MKKKPYFILDEIKGCVGAWGTKRLRKGFTGSPVRVRRGDNVETDIPSCGKNLCNVSLNKNNQYPLTNLLGNEGNFEGDNLNYWESNITGTVELSTAKKLYGNKALYFNLANQGAALWKDIVATTGDKLYCCANALKVSGTLPPNNIVRLFDAYTSNNGVAIITTDALNAAPTNTWIFGSGIKVANGGTRVYLHTTTLSTCEFYVDGVILLNLTQIFGAGFEPSQSVMDSIIQRILNTEGYFTQRDYIYKPQYVSILRDVSEEKYAKLVNLLGTYGNLQSDGNNDGQADGYALTNNPASLSVSNGVQTFTPTGSDSGMYVNAVPAIANNIYYCCAYVTSVGYVKMQIRASAASYPCVCLNSANNTFISLRATALENFYQLYPWILGNSNYSANPISFRQHMCFNLTAIYGSGFEPSQNEMDFIVQRALQDGYFTEYSVPRNTNAIQTSATSQPIIRPIDMSITMNNLLGDYGNFEYTDLIYWGAVGTPYTTTDIKKVGSRSLASVGTTTQVLFKDINSTGVIYTCAYVYLTRFVQGEAGVRLFDYNSTNNPITQTGFNPSLLNQWQFVSAMGSKAGFRVYAGSYNSANLDTYTDCVHAFNLTQIFGAGNEPSQSELDNFMKGEGYFNTKTTQNFGGIVFDGINDYLITPPLEINPNGMTWCVNIRSSNPSAQFVFDHRALDTGIQPLYINAVGALQIHDTSIGTLNSPNGVFKYDNQYHFIVITIGNNSRRIYQDGVLVASDNLGIGTYTARSLYIGCRHNLLSNYNGNMKDKFVFNRMLSEGEVQKLTRAVR